MKRNNILVFSEIYKRNFFESNNYKLPIECGGSQKNLISNLELLKKHYNCFLLVRNLKDSSGWQSNDITLIPTGSIYDFELPSYILIITNLLKNNPFNINTPNTSETIVIVHNNSFLSLLIKLIKPKYRVIFFIENDYKTMFWRPYINFFMKIFFFVFFFLNLLIVDKIIKIKPESWFLENHLSLIKKKSYYLPNYINKKVFNPGKLQEVNTIKVNQIDKNDIVLLYVGRLDDYINKNPSLLFQSYDIVSKKVQNIKLIILGTDRNYGNSLLKKFKPSTSENIIFAGTVPNELTVDYYRRSNLTLLTSNHEGSPYAILESLACGTPCVTTDVVNSNIIKDGINGFISKSKDPENFATLILKGLSLSSTIKPLKKDLLDSSHDSFDKERTFLELLSE